MNIEQMEARLAALEKKVASLDDINRIKRLQYAYSYYVSRMMKEEIVDCFADHEETALYWLEGAYLGKDAVKRYFGIGNEQSHQPPEFLHQVMPIAGVIDLDPDGNRARARWYSFGAHSLPTGDNNFRKSFVAGIYEMEYIKQADIWKILKINWLIPYAIDLPIESWRWPEKIGESIGNPRRSFTQPVADIPFDPADPRFVAGYILPFHYPHPVTGKPTSEDRINNSVINTRKGAKKE